MNPSPDPTDDDRLRRLLDDAVSDVEPRRGLDEIRSRTRSARSRRPWVWGAGGAVLATAATIAAVAVFSSGGPGTTDVDPGPAAGGGQTSAAADDQVNYDVYFVGDTAHGPRLFDEPHPFPNGDKVAVLQRAVDGAADDPDYRGHWPAGTKVESVTGDENSPGSVVVVDLTGPDLATRPADTTVAQAEKYIQQVVWTTRTFSYADSPVEIRVDGRAVSTLLGVPVASPVVAGSADDVLAQVQVTTPAEGSTWSAPDPITVAGRAAAFEANVQWELMQGDRVVKSGFTTAEECCTLSPFSFPIPVPPPGAYTLVVHDEDPSGGEGLPPWQDTKNITVR